MIEGHLFVCFNRGQTMFRYSGSREGDFSGGDPASTYPGSSLDDHYENLANYIKRFRPASIEIRNDLLT